MHAANRETGLVSVIVPTFRRYDLVKLTLESIAAQSYDNLEALVVADGHDERTESVVRNLNDARFCYASIEHRGLPAAARNEGLRRCRGQWIAFCDDDDLWRHDKLELQIPVLANGDFSLCTSDYGFIDEHGKLLPQQNYYEAYYGRFNWRTFYHSMGFICNAAVLLKRDVFERIGLQNENPRLKAHEDFEYWMRALFQADGFFMRDKLVSYRVHSGSIQRNSPYRVFRNRMTLLNSLRRTLPIPTRNHAIRCAKTAVHFLMEQFPLVRRSLRQFQGKPDLAD